MNTYAKLAISAAAVVVVVVVGINLLPSRGGVGGPAIASPSPSAAPQASPTSPPSPSPAAVIFPPAGDLAVGRHPMTMEGVPFTFDIPSSGWVSNGTFDIHRGEGIKPDSAGFIFWSDTPTGVFSDPCKQVEAPPGGQSPSELAAAVARIPGTNLVSGPSDVTVGGYPAKHVVLTIREDVGCDANTFYLWYAPTEGLARYATQLGSTIGVWIVDVGGKLVWIDGETFKGAGPGPKQDIQQIIDSIKFG